MRVATLQSLTLALAGCVVLFSPRGVAQTDVETTIRFAPPKRIMAGDVFLGENRLYPSPAMHDVNGDGRADIVIGDLFGKVTVAPHTGKPMSYGAEEEVKDREGEQLKFHNW